MTEPAAVTPAPEEELERTLRRAAVRTALAALPARDHELIALKFHAGLDNAEIADVLGVSVVERRHAPAPRPDQAPGDPR